LLWERKVSLDLHGLWVTSEHIVISNPGWLNASNPTTPDHDALNFIRVEVL